MKRTAHSTSAWSVSLFMDSPYNATKQCSTLKNKQSYSKQIKQTSIKIGWLKGICLYRLTRLHSGLEPMPDSYRPKSIYLDLNGFQILSVKSIQKENK